MYSSSLPTSTDSTYSLLVTLTLTAMMGSIQADHNLESPGSDSAYPLDSAGYRSIMPSTSSYTNTTHVQLDDRSRIDREFIASTTRAYENLLRNQEPLGESFSASLKKRLWDLYEV